MVFSCPDERDTQRAHVTDLEPNGFKETDTSNTGRSCSMTDEEEDAATRLDGAADRKSETDPLEDIPAQYREVSVKCLREGTLTQLCHYLDPCSTSVTSDTVTPLNKDYRGLGQLCGVDNQRLLYLRDKSDRTRRVLDFWHSDRPEVATLGNLCGHLVTLERLDVLTDCSRIFVLDAEAWLHQRQKQTTAPGVKRSTALTIHDDESTNHQQMYTACLCAADEDWELTSLVNDMFADEDGVKFFCPPHDLIMGLYEHAVTAKVIRERCGGTVVFFVSKNFQNSEACAFCLNFAKSLDPGSNRGRLIPFILDDAEVPEVLVGIWGIKWSKVYSRFTALTNLTEFLFQEYPEERKKQIRSHVTEKLKASPSKWGIPPATVPVSSVTEIVGERRQESSASCTNTRVASRTDGESSGIFGSISQKLRSLLKRKSRQAKIKSNAGLGVDLSNKLKTVSQSDSVNSQGSDANLAENEITAISSSGDGSNGSAHIGHISSSSRRDNEPSSTDSCLNLNETGGDTSLRQANSRTDSRLHQRDTCSEIKSDDCSEVKSIVDSGNTNGELKSKDRTKALPSSESRTTTRIVLPELVEEGPGILHSCEFENDKGGNSNLDSGYYSK